jgi:hypothetical protein
LQQERTLLLISCNNNNGEEETQPTNSGFSSSLSLSLVAGTHTQTYRQRRSFCSRVTLFLLISSNNNNNNDGEEETQPNKQWIFYFLFSFFL